MTSSNTKNSQHFRQSALSFDALTDEHITRPTIEGEHTGDAARTSGVAESAEAVTDYVPSLAHTRNVQREPGQTTSVLASARDKLRSRGSGALTTTELLIVALGPRTEGAVQSLLRRHGAAGFSKLNLDDISGSGRLGKGSASRLAALLEFHRRLKAMEDPHRPKLTKPSEVYEQVKGLGLAKKEHLLGLYLDTQNGLLHTETISIGSLNTTRSHPREILQPAIQFLAHGFILVHNHPSGTLVPSSDDIEFTRAIHRAGQLMGIELYDHVIVTASGYKSLREMGMMP